MKFISIIFILTISLTAFADQQSWYKYSCSVVDGNNFPYWGGSKTSQEEALNRAMNSCYRSSESMGTCRLVSCNSAFSEEISFNNVSSMDGYGCSATDANYGHYYGRGSSHADACAQAMNNCYYHSDAPGTCTLR